MKQVVALALLLTILIPSVAPAAQSYQLTRATFGSAGGPFVEGAPFGLGMTLGQSVIGMGAGPSPPPKTLAEAAGFWIWGHIPVLDVHDPGGPNTLTQFVLYPNAPNPFSRQTSFRYAIPRRAGPTPVTVRLYDLSGRLIRVLDDGLRAPGTHFAGWDGRDETGQPVGGGLYFYRIQAGSFVASRRLALIR